MSLMREALVGYDEDLIPQVYAWNPSSEGGRGWILQEFKQGVQLDQAFGDLNQDHQRDLVRQIARVFKIIQDYRLPSSARGFGGLTFDSSGNIVTGPTTIPCGGPFHEFHHMYVQMLRRQLDESDTSERLQGWRRNGLRDRLDRLAAEGIAQLVKNNSFPRPTLVHGDFSASSPPIKARFLAATQMSAG
jgi:hypothetical protein